MAICPNCGNDNVTNAIFCETCGTLISGAQNIHVPVEPEIISKVRKIGSSGFMLTIAILQSIIVAVSIPKVTSQFQLSVNFPISAIIICIGFWLIYGACKKPEGSLISTSGISTLRVWSMLCIIGYSLLIVLLALVGTILPIIFSVLNEQPNVFYNGNDFIASHMMGIFIALLFMAVLSLAFSLLVSIFAFRFLGSVRETITTGYPVCKSAAPLAVFSIIGAGISFITSTASLVFRTLLDTVMDQFMTLLQNYFQQQNIVVEYTPGIVSGMGHYVSLILSVLSLVLSILIAVIALRYRKQVKETVQ